MGKNKTLSVFDVLSNITSTKPILSESEVLGSGLNTVLLLQYLSSNIQTTPIAQFLNVNWKIDIYDMYVIAKDMSINIRVNYIKREKYIDDIENKYIYPIMDFYTVGKDVARDYYQSLSENHIEQLNDISKQRKG